MKNTNTSLLLIASLLLLVVFTGCSNKEVVDACLDGHTFGFWGGLWHGIIAPVNFVLMFFRDDITIYAQNTNGTWYAFGFLLGSGGWGFLGGKGIGKKRRDCK